MAKQSKEQSTQGKRTGIGERLSDIERAQLKEQAFKDKMSQYIKDEVLLAKQHKGNDIY